MQAWLCVYDPQKFAMSDYQSSLPVVDASELLGSAPLAHIQQYSVNASPNLLSYGAAAFKPGGGPAATWHHLESQVLAARMLQSLLELQHWAQLYATLLVDRLGGLLPFEDRGRPRSEEMLRLRALLELLMGPRDPVVAPETALGRDVLGKVVLPLVATQAQLQPLAARYQQELEFALQ